MTREEAIWWVNHLFEIRKEEYFNKGMMEDAKEVEEAQRMAIEALSADTVSREQYDHVCEEYNRLVHKAVCIKLCDENCEYKKGKTCYHAREHSAIEALTYQNLSKPNNTCEADLIRREDAMSAVQDHFNADGFKGYYDGQKMMDRITALPSAEAEWIPVSEKPKDEKRTYLVQLDGSGMCSCRWTNVNPFWTDLTTEWHWCIFDLPQYSKVVAWMDLEPYKGGEDE